MNIDSELDILIEGFIKNFNKKRNNKKNEKILRDRRELRSDIKKLPIDVEAAIEHAVHTLEEDYSFEGVHEMLADVAIMATAVIKGARNYEQEEIQAAKTALNKYNTAVVKIINMIKSNKDTRRREESLDLMKASALRQVLSDYNLEVPSQMHTNENIIKSYNQLMAEKQHPTDN